MTWTDERVDAAFADWVWMPDGVEVYPVALGRLIHYPAYVGNRVQVVPSAEPVATREAIDEIVDLAHRIGETEVRVHVGATPANEPLTNLLLTLGAEVAETLDRLALLLDQASPPRTSNGLDLRPVLDDEAAVAMNRVDQAAFDAPALTGEALAQSVAQCRRSWQEHSGAQILAWRGDQAVGSGGLSMEGEVARLWGGATIPEARRQGVYAAVLAERLRLAHEWGGTLALVKGRIDTSAPILRRLGFLNHGREITYRLTVG